MIVVFLLSVSVFAGFCQQNTPFAEFTKISIPDSIVFIMSEVKSFNSVQVTLVSDGYSIKGNTNVSLRIKVNQDTGEMTYVPNVTATNFNIPDGFVAKEISIFFDYKDAFGRLIDKTVNYDIAKKTWD